MLVEYGNDPNEATGEKGASQTQGARCYEFDLDARYSPVTTLRLIDTPGIGDVRGTDQDKINFQNTLRFLTQFEQLDAICVLLPSNNSRMTLSFRYCIKELLKHLHINAKDNILFCFTNCRGTLYRPGDTLDPLKELLNQMKKDKEQPVEIPVSKNTMYCFDNEAFRFVLAVKQGILLEETELFEKSWYRSVQEFQRLLKRAHDLKPHDLQETFTLNKCRSTLNDLTHPLALITKNINDNIRLAEERRTELEQLGAAAKNLESKRMKKVAKVDLDPLSYPKTICTQHFALKGQTKVYTQVCHDRCGLVDTPPERTDEPALQQCAAMSNGTCTHCNHSWRLHMHIRYNVVETEVLEEDKLVANELAKCKNDKYNKEQLMAEITEEIEQMKKEQEKLLSLSANIAQYLQKNAIAPYNEDLGNYLQKLISEEEDYLRMDPTNKKKKQSLESLKANLHTFESEVNAFREGLKAASSLKTPGDVLTAIGELNNLSLFGSSIQTLSTQSAQIRQQQSGVSSSSSVRKVPRGKMQKAKDILSSVGSALGVI